MHLSAWKIPFKCDAQSSDQVTLNYFYKYSILLLECYFVSSSCSKYILYFLGWTNTLQWLGNKTTINRTILSNNFNYIPFLEPYFLFSSKNRLLWYGSPNNKTRRGNSEQSIVASSISRSQQGEEHKYKSWTQDLREGEKLLLTWEEIQEFTMDPL